MIEPVVLSGTHVRLEPLERRHVAALLAAAAAGSELFRWTTIPRTQEEMAQYVETARQWQAEGSALAFATVRKADAAVIGSTRFFLIERWAWPNGHERRGIDGCEIGYTWLAPQAIRTAANTEAKYLMLRHAFEAWNALRVCFHTDARNERSRAALARIGAQFEGILRAHRLSSDLKPRDSARFSVLDAEWPAVKRRLEEFLARP